MSCSQSTARDERSESLAGAAREKQGYDSRSDLASEWILTWLPVGSET